MTTRRRFYLAVALAALAGLGLILVLPDVALVVLAALVPVSIAGAVVSTIYLRRVYVRQPIPRSRFFRMLVEMFGGLLVIGGWVGYLTVARITERAHLAGDIDWNLPAPPTGVSSPLSAVIVIAVFSAPARFAWEIFRLRRRAEGELPPAELDRET